MGRLAKYLIWAAVFVLGYVFFGLRKETERQESGWAAVDAFYEEVGRDLHRHPATVVKWVNYIAQHRDRLGDKRQSRPRKIEGQTKVYHYLEDQGTDKETLRKLMALHHATNEMATISRRAGIPDDQWRRETGEYYSYFRAYTRCPTLFTMDGTKYSLQPTALPAGKEVPEQPVTALRKVDSETNMQ